MFVRRRQILTKLFASKTDYTRAWLGHKSHYKMTLFSSTSEAYPNYPKIKLRRSLKYLSLVERKLCAFEIYQSLIWPAAPSRPCCWRGWASRGRGSRRGSRPRWAPGSGSAWSYPGSQTRALSEYREKLRVINWDQSQVSTLQDSNLLIVELLPTLG